MVQACRDTRDPTGAFGIWTVKSPSPAPRTHSEREGFAWSPTNVPERGEARVAFRCLFRAADAPDLDSPGRADALSPLDQVPDGARAGARTSGKR